MRLSIATTAACVACAHAFQDTSPFFFFSSSPLPKSLKDISSVQLQPLEAVIKTTKAFLNECPSKIYYIISQPSISAQDLNGSDNVPFLKRALSDPGTQAKYTVAEVVGQKNATANDLAAYIKSHCGGVELDYQHGQRLDPKSFTDRTTIVQSIMKPLPPIASKRGEKLAENDHYIDSFLLQKLVKLGKYTVIYTTTSLLEPVREEYVYDSWDEGMHQDLKRDLDARVPPKTTTNDQRPLFEKYQFLTPGIFMGLLTVVFLLSILTVGMKAVASLQVSYGAFEKEMGPAAQKNQ